MKVNFEQCQKSNCLKFATSHAVDKVNMWNFFFQNDPKHEARDETNKMDHNMILC